MTLPGVNEDQLQVETCTKHKHVAIETHLGDGAARQRVANSNEADIVKAVLNMKHVSDSILTANFDVSTAVNHLITSSSSSSSSAPILITL